MSTIVSSTGIVVACAYSSLGHSLISVRETGKDKRGRKRTSPPTIISLKREALVELKCWLGFANVQPGAKQHKPLFDYLSDDTNLVVTLSDSHTHILLSAVQHKRGRKRTTRCCTLTVQGWSELLDILLVETADQMKGVRTHGEHCVNQHRSWCDCDSCHSLRVARADAVAKEGDPR